MPRLPQPGRRRPGGVAASASVAATAGAALAAAAAGAVGMLRWSHAACGFVAAAPSAAAAGGAATASASASSAAAGLLGTGLPDSFDAQLLIAEEKDIIASLSRRTPNPLINEDGGPDLYYPIFIVAFVSLFLIGIGIVIKPYWEKRWLQENIQNSKLKFISQESSVTPEDQYELGRLYIQLPDPSSALAEFEEVEDEFDDMRRVLDPEDAMGALAARAMLHNSKGYALTNLEPPRTAQARREFVRAVTYWPEYPEGLLNIGRELLKRKRYDVALRTLNTALKWQPGSEFIKKAHVQAQMGLDELEYQKMEG